MLAVILFSDQIIFFLGFFCGLESAGNFFAYVAYDSLVESRDHAVTLRYILLSLRTPILSQQVLRSKSHISRKSINETHSEGVVNTMLSAITNKNRKTYQENGIQNKQVYLVQIRQIVYKL
jgi:hypothetical protein